MQNCISKLVAGNLARKSMTELKSLEANWLPLVGDLTPITGAMVIRMLGDVRGEIERRESKSGRSKGNGDH